MSHMTESSRIKLEHFLNEGYTIRNIAKKMNYSPSSISREINRNLKTTQANTYGINVLCSHRKICPLLKNSTMTAKCSVHCPNYKLESCSLFQKKNASPVCNGCPNLSRCRLAKKIYKANIAVFKSNDRMLKSRAASRITAEQLAALNAIFSPRLKQGQSISVIYNNHQNEIMVSENTIRSYVRNGLFDADVLDTIHPRFASKSSQKRRVIRNIELLSGRTYADYLAYIRKEDTLVCQVDTVVGKLSDKQRLLTLHWPNLHFQIGILIAGLNPLNVNRAFSELRSLLGHSLYRRMFQTILTDNGIEFSMLDELEADENGEIITRVFFTDPYNSSQKGACERNHQFIRYILPKGLSLDFLTKKDVDLIFSHINSTPRHSLGFVAPATLFATSFGIEALKLLSIQLIPKDDIILKPSLITCK